MNRRRGALRAVLAGLAVPALVLVGCSSGAPATTSSTSPTAGPGTTATTPAVPEGFQAVTVVVTLPDGSVREWCVWLADTPELRQRGLMGVSDPGLGGAVGMVFVFPGDTTASFWMKDTLVPLSIAWYPTDGPLVSTADMDPCPAGVERCPSFAPGGSYRYAVEVPQGTLAGFGLVEGSRMALGGPCEPSGTET